MNWFIWHGITQTGSTTKGYTQAQSIQHLQELLLNQGIALFKAKKTDSKPRPFALWQNALTQQQRFDFFDHLALLLTNGIPLTTALEIMHQQTNIKFLSAMFNTIKTSIVHGNSLATALSSHPESFSPFIIHLIAAGERTGHLGPVLEHLKEHLKHMLTLRAQLKKAFMMPLATLSTSLTLLLIILIFVIPHFNTLYLSLGCKIPPATRIAIYLSDLFASWTGFLIIISIIPLTWLIKQTLSHPRIRSKIYTLMLHVPFVSTIFIQQEVLRLLDVLTLFLKSGFPLTQALEHANQSTSAPVFQKHTQHLLAMIVEGKNLSQGMDEIGKPFFDPHLIAFIRVGEHANTLAPILEKATTLYRNKLTTMLHTLTVIASPLFMIIIGLIIGSLMILMYLPILNLGTLFNV